MHALVTQFRNFFFQERFWGRKRGDGRTGETEHAQDSTRLAEIEELKRAIRALLFVTKLSPVDAHKDKVAGWGVCLTCYSCPDNCDKKETRTTSSILA